MNICVYGSANDFIDPAYLEQGEKLGRQIALAGNGLVFGGGATGMMGAVARGVRAESGYILGVAPKFFDKEGVLYQQCNEFIFTDTMRQRKQIMEDRSDAFVVSPGGLGTFEECLEMLTLRQLGQHHKPIILWNINGYYDPLIHLFEHAIKERFIEPKAKEYFISCSTVEQILGVL